jgi:phenylacetate-CoA ligase
VLSIRAKVRDLYGKSPQKLQTIIGRFYASLPLKWHFGRDFEWGLSVAEEAYNWSGNATAAFQEQQIGQLLNRVREIRFYKERGSIADFNDMAPLTKEQLKDYSETVNADDLRRFRAERVATGGSTGEPVSLYLDRKGLAVQKATRRVHEQIVTGIQGPRQIQLRGVRYDAVLPGDTQFAVKSFDGKTLYLNSYTLSKDTAEHFYDAWNKFKPEAVFAYPSTLSEFASLAQIDDVRLFSPRAIITSSETLLDEQRSLIESALSSPIHDFYGLTECECIAFEREQNGDYVVDCHICFVELLVGDRPAEAGEIAEIVITHLHNFAQPIIRYRTGDMAIGAVDGRLPNGSWCRLRSIQGRIQENLIAHDGAPISLVAFRMHANYWRNVVAYQFVQLGAGRASLRLKVFVPLEDHELKMIEKDILEKSLDRVDVEFLQVTRLFRTRRGKTPGVVPADRVLDFDYGVRKWQK